MAFYQEFSTYYDEIFPLVQDKLNFLMGYFKEYQDDKILDIGAGTGNYTLALAEQGYNLTGIDLDKKMIDIANKKAREKEVTIDFKVADMLAIDSVFNENEFAAAYSLGNVLVHLNSRHQVDEFFKKLSFVVRPGGLFIGQIINYDRIIDKNITGLSKIINEDKGVSLSRKYVNKNEQGVIFKTRLAINQGNIIKAYLNSIELIALRADELVNSLKNAGFGGIKQFGNFKGDKLIIDQSIPCITLAFNHK